MIEASSLRVCVSQTLISPSKLPLNNRFPSGEKASDVTTSLCPSQRCRDLPILRDQRRITCHRIRPSPSASCRIQQVGAAGLLIACGRRFHWLRCPAATADGVISSHWPVAAKAAVASKAPKAYDRDRMGVFLIEK